MATSDWFFSRFVIRVESLNGGEEIREIGYVNYFGFALHSFFFFLLSVVSKSFPMVVVSVLLHDTRSTEAPPDLFIGINDDGV
jgi:hypothetical protein